MRKETQQEGKVKKALFSMVMGLALSGVVHAGDVEIVKVAMQASGSGQWRANVTLKHADTGWEHYADAWRVMTEEGKLLGTRVLYHPHVNEQPFTRSHTVKVPPGTSIVYVEAHDKVHGWNKDRVRVDLSKAKGPRFSVRR